MAASSNDGWVEDTRGNKAKERKEKKAFRAASLTDFEAKEWARVCKLHEEESKAKWDTNQQKWKDESEKSYEERARQAVVAACRNFVRNKEAEFEKYITVRREMKTASDQASAVPAVLAKKKKRPQEKDLVYSPATVLIPETREEPAPAENIVYVSSGRVGEVARNPYALPDDDE